MRNAETQVARWGRAYEAAWAIAIAIVLAPGLVHAFSEPNIYADEAQTGGGGGRWFSGSPAEGYDCSVCHNAQLRVPLHHNGLPIEGWVPGQSYTIKLAWPEAAAQALSAQAAGLRPSTSLVAELVAEDGGPSGTIELQPSFAAPGELCAAADSGVILAASVFSINGTDPASRGTSCTAVQKNERCVVAVAACGSSELRVRWTAPARWGGPIWFSASMVSTLNANGVPDDGEDAVTSLSMPLNAASEPDVYDLALSAGCNTVLGARSASSPSGCWCLILGMALLRRARVCAMIAVVLIGCARPPAVDLENVGLFTPGYRPSSALPPRAAAGAAALGGSEEALMCMGQTFATTPDADGGAASSQGSLQVDFSTGLLPAGDYDKAGMQENYGVVWIEDDAGRYVSGLTQWGEKYRLRLTTWLFGSGRTPVEPLKGRLGCADPDIVTQPTIHMHTRQTVLWRSTDTAGDIVPDGNYTLWFEVQIDERHIQSAVSFPFVKGRVAWAQTIAPAPPLQALTLTYTPES